MIGLPTEPLCLPFSFLPVVLQGKPSSSSAFLAEGLPSHTLLTAWFNLSNEES